MTDELFDIASEVQEKKRILDAKDKEILKLKLEQPSRTMLELSELTGISWRQIATRISRPHFKRAMARAQRKAIDIILDAKERAAYRLIELIDSKDEQAALKASIAILADILPAKRLNITGKIEHEQILTDEQINAKVEQLLYESGIDTEHIKPITQAITKT